MDNCPVYIIEDEEEYYNIIVFQEENNLSYLNYSKLSWTVCYNKNYLIYESNKLESG